MAKLELRTTRHIWGGVAVVGTCTTNGDRTKQQDRVKVVSSPGLRSVVLADGHYRDGGTCASFSCRHAHHYVREDLDRGEDLPVAIRMASLLLDDAILGAYKAGRMKRGGTCMVAAFLRGGTLAVGNVGDCRCLASRDGSLLPMSSDHAQGNNSEEARVEELGFSFDDAGFLGGELSVSRALGDHHLGSLKPGEDPRRWPLSALAEVQTTDGTKLDFAVLATDGIWKRLSSAQVHRQVRWLLSAGTDVEEAARRVVRRLERRARQVEKAIDNATIAIISFN